MEPIPWAIGRLAERVAGAGLGRSSFRSTCVVAGTWTPPSSPSSQIIPVGSAGHVRARALSHPVPITVSQLTVDTIRASAGIIRFVKIDVEGAEPDVLRGATRVLDEDRPVVHVEIASESLDAHGFDVADVWEPLVRAGYDIYDLLGNHLTSPTLYLRSVSHPALIDYIALHPDDVKRGEIRYVLRHSSLSASPLDPRRPDDQLEVRSPPSDEPTFRGRWAPYPRDRIVALAGTNFNCGRRIEQIAIRQSGDAVMCLVPTTNVVLDA